MDSVGFEGNVEDIRGGAIGDAARRAKADALDDTRSWIDPRGYRLSERIWSARQSDRDAIQQILREAIASGQDPLQAARRLEVYLTPEGRRLTTTTPPIRRGTPQEYRSGKGSYAARRLARTEITRAHGQATLQAAAENEFVTGVRWNLSPSHPKVDICDEHARRDRGLGPGVYRVEDVPRYPAHPHCLCNLSPVVAEDAIDRIIARTRAEQAAPATVPVVEPPPQPSALERLRQLAAERAAEQQALARSADAARAGRAIGLSASPQGFQSANRIADAVKAAKQLGVAEVDLKDGYSGRTLRKKLDQRALNAVNLVNEAFTEVVARGLPVPRSVVIRAEMTADTIAGYDPRTGQLRINVTTGFWDDAAKKMGYFAKDGHFTSADPKDLIIHEIGHSTSLGIGNEDRIRDGKTELTDAEKAIARSEISDYAATTRGEFVAEAFVRLFRGRQLSSEVLDRFVRWGGVMP